MMLIGVLWAMFAPLLLLIAIWILVLVAKKISVPKPWRVLGPVVVVVGTTLASWVPQRFAFETHCESLGKPTILETAIADGFFLDDSTANSFGMRYLQEEGFSWMEAKSIYDRSRFTRYEIVDGRIEQREIEQTSTDYTVRSTLRIEEHWNTNETEILETKSGKRIAWASRSHFDGGTARWVLGVYGTASCPDPRTKEGSEAFMASYHLARNTLRPKND